MKGLINAVGIKDSLGRDRFSEIRGLIRFGGKALINHTLEKLEEIGINDILILTNPNHEVQYANEIFRKGNQVTVLPYNGDQDPLVVYLTGALMFEKEDVFIVADDNIFDFSLVPMIKKFGRVRSSVLATLPIKKVIEGSEEDLNFGTCSIGKNGKVVRASYSFDPTIKVDSSQRIVLDIYAVHRDQISRARHIVTSSTKDLATEWYSGFYAWTPRHGFWADVGKPYLRSRAESYFEIKK